MSAPVFLVLNRDRLLLLAEAIIAVDELGEDDIDIRTGKLALGIPEGSVTRIHTIGGTFYVKTSYDDVLKAVLALHAEDAR